jgi:hypothetical protein
LAASDVDDKINGDGMCSSDDTSIPDLYFDKREPQVSSPCMYDSYVVAGRMILQIIIYIHMSFEYVSPMSSMTSRFGSLWLNTAATLRMEFATQTPMLFIGRIWYTNQR